MDIKELRDRIMEELAELRTESQEAYKKAVHKNDSDDASYCRGREAGVQRAMKVVDDIIEEMADEY